MYMIRDFDYLPAFVLFSKRCVFIIAALIVKGQDTYGLECCIIKSNDPEIRSIYYCCTDLVFEPWRYLVLLKLKGIQTSDNVKLLEGHSWSVPVKFV